MEKEIIIERKKSKSIRISLFIFIITLIMILPIVFYFGDFDFITSDIYHYSITCFNLDYNILFQTNI